MDQRPTDPEIVSAKSSLSSNETGDQARAPLQPTSLVPPRRQWWVMAIGGGIVSVVALIDVGLGGDKAALIVAALAGFWAILSAVMLLPGAHALRLDGDGFEIKHFFRTKRHRWIDVSDFAVRRIGEFSGELVAFETTESDMSLWERINGALLGSKGHLPNTYGRSAEDLAKLMNTWKQSVVESAK